MKAHKVRDTGYVYHTPSPKYTPQLDNDDTEP